MDELNKRVEAMVRTGAGASSAKPGVLKARGQRANNDWTSAPNGAFLWACGGGSLLPSAASPASSGLASVKGLRTILWLDTEVSYGDKAQLK